MSSPHSRWRAPVTGAVAGLAVAAAIVGPSAVASGGQAASAPTTAKAAQATAPPCAAPTGSRPAAAKAAGAQPGPGPFLAVVAQLAQAGTITNAQAHVLDAGIRTGSIDAQQLIANGTLSAAQMHTVIDRLGAVKQSLAPRSQPSAGPGSGKAKAAQG